jgi:hypothetical protein
MILPETGIQFDIECNEALPREGEYLVFYPSMIGYIGLSTDVKHEFYVCRVEHQLNADSVYHHVIYFAKVR